MELLDYGLRASLTLLLGLAGWRAALRLQMPAAAILGPMLLIGAAACLGAALADFPAWLKTSAQAIIGVFLGLKFNRITVLRAKSLVWPIVVANAWLLLSGLLIGYALMRLARVDLNTSLLGTTPGGIVEMTVMAGSFQADVALVATLQAFRLVSANVSIPILARRQVNPHSPSDDAVLFSHSRRVAGVSCRAGWPICMLMGLSGGFFLTWLQVPAGGVVGALLAVGAIQLAGVEMAPLPAPIRNAAQVLAGIFIGLTFSAQTLVELRAAFLTIVVTTAATLASSLLLARFIQHWLRLDAQTALLACAPGGLVQMGIIADELGAQTFVVSLFQFTRIVCVIVLAPLVFRMLI